MYLLNEKFEATSVFKQFHKMILNQFETNIKILHTNNGREYYSNILGEYLQKEGIIHHSSCIDTPQQNGVLVRKNRHLLEVAHAMMFQMNIPKLFWGEAILTTSYLINRMPTHVLKYETPINTLKQCFPASHHLFSSLTPKFYGCTACVHINGHNHSKFDPRAHKCIFLGYHPT